MKDKLFTLIALIGFALISSGQDFHGGVLFGVGGTEISGDRLSGPHKAGLYLGGFVNRNFGERSSLQMELIIFRKEAGKILTPSALTLTCSDFHISRFRSIIVMNLLKEPLWKLGFPLVF
jgi:hypothetical protein